MRRGSGVPALLNHDSKGCFSIHDHRRDNMGAPSGLPIAYCSARGDLTRLVLGLPMEISRLDERL